MKKPQAKPKPNEFRNPQSKDYDNIRQALVAGRVGGIISRCGEAVRAAADVAYAIGKAEAEGQAKGPGERREMLIEALSLQGLLRGDSPHDVTEAEQAALLAAIDQTRNGD